MSEDREKTRKSSQEEEELREPRHGTGRDAEGCRCKEVADMKPKQLLGTMLKDLAFWKKGRK